eukprot:7003884-Ditylum_brightwellii.AAC.1
MQELLMKFIMHMKKEDDERATKMQDTLLDAKNHIPSCLRIRQTSFTQCSIVGTSEQLPNVYANEEMNTADHPQCKETKYYNKMGCCKKN